MSKKRLLWQLFPSYLLVVVISLIAISLYFSFTLRQFHLEQTRADLENNARLVAFQIEALLGAVNSDADVEKLLREIGPLSAARATVITSTGRVIGDTEKAPSQMENHADRPEIRQAFEGRVGHAIRFSGTMQKNMMYVALPVSREGRVDAVVRTSLPATTVFQELRSISSQILLSGLIIAILAALVSLYISRFIARPLEEMKLGAQRFAKGDFSRALQVGDNLELGGLADSLNTMSEQLDDRINTIVRQRNEFRAVLTSMVEGVIAVDPEMRIISLNEAAARLLGFDASKARGQHLQEAVRNADLLRFLTEVFTKQKTLEGEIVLYHDEERYLQTHGTILHGEQGEHIGALVVLNDVTRLRKLENFRREFVANVSHELRTPITSIKGFVEALSDGALAEPERAERFLSVISKHTDRLSTLIEDLLTLSRIEQEPADQAANMEESSVEEIILSAIQACQIKADENGVSLEHSCLEGLTALVNPSLMEQAVINLVDNAIKYSPEGKPVRVMADTADGEITISVSDQGCGIESDHIPRLFERFYRADKARSRALGGTGLGLAIVKHIVQTHGGSVDVESTPGEGSIFTIRLAES